MISIPNKETLTVEFKSDRKRLPDNDLIVSLVGMANAEGGDLYLGVEDDGTVSGVHRDHADKIGVEALVSNKTTPMLSVCAELIDVNGIDVLRIRVPQSQALIAASDGRIFRRILKFDGSPENVPMHPYELLTRVSNFGSFDFSSQVLRNAAYDDLDPNERLRLRDMIRRRNGETNLLEIPDEDLDKALHLVKEESGVLYPTVTGMILLGKEGRLQEVMPTAKAVFQVLEGTRVRMNEQLAQPLLSTFDKMETWFKAWNPTTEMRHGLFRIPIPEFSEDAFREGLINAFCHRDYSILQSVRLVVEDDGMSIGSPGGFIEGVNLQNLLSVEPHGRNPTLAEALKRIGLAERTGRGIDRIFEGSIMYGRPLPDYSGTTSRAVKLFLQRSKPDLAFTEMIFREEEKTGRTLSINALLILSTLQTQRRMSAQELSDSLHINASRVRASLEWLVESGLIEAVRGGTAREYMLSRRVYRAQNNVIGYVRQTQIEDLKKSELVTKLAREQGFVTRENVAELLGLNGDQAYRILRKLADEGLLKLEGRGRVARYRSI